MVALIFQKVVLPMFPDLHAGYGLLTNDAVYYHNAARYLADGISSNGWSLESIISTWPGASGHVTILGLLYYFFGIDPSLVTPINAAVHASSGILLYLIANTLVPGRIGKISGIIAAIMFVVFPSSLNWYAQVHKDGYSIFGVFLVLYSWLKYLDSNHTIKSYIHYFAGSLVAIAFIYFVRPYNGILISAILGIWLLLFLVYICFQRKWVLIKTYFIPSLIIEIIFLTFAFNYASLPMSSKYEEWQASIPVPDMDRAQYKAGCLNWSWQETTFVPNKIDEAISIISASRAGLMCINYNASSNINKEILPDNFLDSVKYMPIGLWHSIMSPMPSTWLEKLSIPRFVGAFEILLWYLLIPGFLIALRSRFSVALCFCLVFSFGFLLVYGYTVSNLGSLHRLRYPFIHVLMLLGVIGSIHYLMQLKWLRFVNYIDQIKEKLVATNYVGVRSLLVDKNRSLDLRDKFRKGGILVIFITIVTYLGFFARDVILARGYGLGDDLDTLFIALLIPMFFVNVFCESFGASSIPVYMDAHNKSKEDGDRVLTNLVIYISKYLLVICVSIAIAGPLLIKIIGWDFSDEKHHQALMLLYSTLPLLFFSGILILGNSILNARMRFTIPALSQSIVPVFSIVALIIGAKHIGIVSVLLGMIVGQVVNLIIVESYLRKDSLSLIPKLKYFNKDIHYLNKKQFYILVISMLFIQLSVVIDQAMASTLDTGSVAVLGLGVKIVFFATGIIGTVITMVILPYFSHYISRDDHHGAKKELSVLIVLATISGVLVSVAMFVLTPYLINIVFLGGEFKKDNADLLIQVVRMGVMQVPYYACYFLLVKFSTALKNNKPIMLSASLGVITNVVLNYFFMQWIGVPGIALATSFSMLVSASAILLIVCKEGNIGGLDIIFIWLSWLLYLTLMMCIYYSSYAGVVASAIPLILLMINSIRGTNNVLMHQYG
jgi:murein biosynthesis integral membrane protein MurJ